jgi:hypothetical protein
LIDLFVERARASLKFTSLPRMLRSWRSTRTRSEYESESGLCGNHRGTQKLEDLGARR